jgi:hypothetical protein
MTIEADLTVLRFLGPSDNPVTSVREFVRQFPEYPGRRLRWDDDITFIILELWHDHNHMEHDEPIGVLKARLGIEG